MLIEGLLTLAALAVTVLVVGAVSLAQVAALPDSEEPAQGATATDKLERDMEHYQKVRDRRPPPIVPLIMIDSSGESAAILAEFYRNYDQEGA